VSPFPKEVKYGPLLFQFGLDQARGTYVVVGEAVTVLPPVSDLPIEEHLSVTFASHPFNCSMSIRPSGLIGRKPSVCVGAAVSSLSE